MPRRKYGDMEACERCGHDIQWFGRTHGWLDRGSSRYCGVYERRGENGLEFVYPKNRKHRAPKR